MTLGSINNKIRELLINIEPIQFKFNRWIIKNNRYLSLVIIKTLNKCTSCII